MLYGLCGFVDNIVFISQGVVPTSNVTVFLGLHDLSDPNYTGLLK